MRILIILWVVFSSLIFSSQTVHAMWGSEAQPIAKEVNSLLRSTTTDGAGGAIISWDRGGPTARIEIQRIDASGDILWQKNGIGVSSSMRQQVGPGVLNDGLVNTIVVWTERELQWGRYPIANSADIYAQKIDGSGNLLWGPEGIQITNIQNSDQTFSGMVSDGNGGAFIAWMDYRNGNPDVYMQHIDNNGSLLWDVNGVPICTTPDTQGGILMTPDDSGGVVIAWNDYRNDVFNIYAQKINTNGDYLWQSNGVQVATERVKVVDPWWTRGGPSIVSDGNGGAIIVWPDFTAKYYNYLYSKEIFAQRIDGDGNIKWSYNGEQISAAGYSLQKYPWTPNIASDGNGGAFILWNDRGGRYSAGRVVARRIDNDGNFPWGTSERVIFENEPWWGVSVSSVVSDGQGGGIVAFGAQNPCHGYESDVYTQRFDSAGNTLWNPKGVNASNLPSADFSGGFVSDGKGGAITIWQNWDSSYYIYAQHVSKDGQIAGERTVAPPTNLEVTKGGDNVFLTWDISLNDVQLVGYNIYRALHEGAFSYIGSVKAGTNAFTDLTASVDSDYCYVVRASNGCEESADSNRACTVSNQMPFANAGPDQTIECAGPSGASVTLNASASSDPDSALLTYTWTWAGGSAEGANPTISLPLGTTVVTLTVSDGKITATDTVSIAVRDSTPSFTTATGGSENWYNSNVISTFSAYDTCSGVKEIRYSIDGSETVTPGSYASATISTEGIHNITYYAVDNAGNIESTKSMTIMIDKTSPVLNLSSTPNILWPPDHKIADVFIGGNATDATSGISSVAFIVVDKYGIVQPSVSSFNTTIQLEAWREGTDMDGRYYTITAVATDIAGNKSIASAIVLVPHDQGN